MKAFWDKRYSEKVFAYGQEPNLFFKQEIVKLPIGTILLPAEGEGRNAVFAATLGWNSFACDISNQGKEKALTYANSLQVTIDYKVGDFGALTYKKNSFDCVALIYAHFPPHQKAAFHKLAADYVKVGGTIIFEGFSKKQVGYSAKNPKAGGPKKVEILFSVDEIKADFKDFEILELSEQEIELNEGLFHNGKSSVIRFVGRKK